MVGIIDRAPFDLKSVEVKRQKKADDIIMSVKFRKTFNINCTKLKNQRL